MGPVLFNYIIYICTNESLGNNFPFDNSRVDLCLSTIWVDAGAKRIDRFVAWLENSKHWF